MSSDAKDSSDPKFVVDFSPTESFIEAWQFTRPEFVKEMSVRVHKPTRQIMQEAAGPLFVEQERKESPVSWLMLGGAIFFAVIVIGGTLWILKGGAGIGK